MNSNNGNDAILDPPSFDFPQEYYENPSDFELWSLRAPVKFDLTQLNGQILQVQNLDDLASGGRNEVILTSFQIDQTDDVAGGNGVESGNDNGSGSGNENHTYHLSLSQADETQSFRLLTSKKSRGYKMLGLNRSGGGNSDNGSDDSEDEIDDDSEKEMVPLPIPFARNLNIVQSTHSNITDLDLAPSIERAAKVDVKKEKMRIPYVKIEQKTGLKKRWNVFGSNCIPTPAMPRTADTNITETPTITKRKVSDDDNDGKAEVRSPEKNKKKRARKESRKKKNITTNS